jgi:chaperonin GroEL (HSP60 family)
VIWFLKQQLTVVKSSLGVLNETLSHMVYNEDISREGLTKLQHYVDSVVSQAHNVTNFFYFKITVESYVARVFDALTVLRRNFDILVNSIVGSRKGILHPQVIPLA